MGNLFDRIKQTVQKLKTAPLPQARPSAPAAHPGAQPVLPSPPGATEEQEDLRRRMGYATQARITHTIREAAQQRRLLYMLYDAQWRYVEPYSFRKGPNGALFYGFCLTHNDTHSFLVYKIEQCIISDIPFTARWPIEL